MALLEKDPFRRVLSAEHVCELLRDVARPKAIHQLAGALTPHELQRSRLVGREAPVHAFHESLARAEAGAGSYWLVGGESGVGKTRLLKELALHAERAGVTVIFGQCAELSDTPAAGSLPGIALRPLGAFLSWLSDSLGDSGAPAPSLLTALAVLADYEPALADVPGVADVSLPTLQPELARARVLRSLLDASRYIARDCPVFLVIDDIQWADDLTLGFLCALSQQAIAESKLIVAVGYRSEELRADLQRELAERANQRFVLQRLTLDQVTIMTRDMLGTELPPAGLPALLHRHSDGNPFFVSEYLRALAAEGALRADTGIGRAALQLESGPIQLPSSLRELFALRRSQMNSDTRVTLELASILGRDFPIPLLERIAREDDVQVDTRLAVTVLLGHRVLEQHEPGRLQFAHDKFREAQEEAISAERRRRLHEIAAKLMSERSESVPLAQLGLHWARAGHPLQALECLESAADQAMQRYANNDAIELYEHATSQIMILCSEAEGERRWASRRARISQRRGDVFARSARHQEA
ncbi:MAG TPA: AAA family ATPase, partial [Polyangiaceae bacterium]|nr:AAA family ATPase [Polyangiaceae bacterium]